MRRTTFVLGLASSAVAVALVVLIYSVGSDRSVSTVEPRRGEANQVQQTASVDMELSASSVETLQRSETDPQNPVVRETRRKTSRMDETETRKWVREETTREVREDYSLLIEHLDLSSSEREALLKFLIEDAIARTKTPYSDGIGMDEHERSARIAEVIGDAKLQQFLALERSLGEYREVQYVQSMLQQKGVPLTEAQRDGLLKILIDVREQIDMKRPAHIKRGTIESLEHTLSQLDDYDRLVTELAPSVLSAKQVEYMFERNQVHSYRRANRLEWDKQRRAENPDDNLPLSYPAKRD